MIGIYNNPFDRELLELAKETSHTQRNAGTQGNWVTDVEMSCREHMHKILREVIQYNTSPNIKFFHATSRVGYHNDVGTNKKHGVIIPFDWTVPETPYTIFYNFWHTESKFHNEREVCNCDNFNTDETYRFKWDHTKMYVFDCTQMHASSPYTDGYKDFFSFFI